MYGRCSSVGRALDCRAGVDCGFDYQSQTNTQGLKIAEKMPGSDVHKSSVPDTGS